MIETEVYRTYYYKGDWARVARYALIVLFGASAAAFMIIRYANVLGALVLLISSIVMLVFVSMPAKKSKLSITEDTIYLDETAYSVSLIQAWVMVDLDDVVEFCLHTTDTKPFTYFYCSKEDPLLPEVSLFLGQNVAYNLELAGEDLLHRILKALRLG